MTQYLGLNARNKKLYQKIYSFLSSNFKSYNDLCEKTPQIKSSGIKDKNNNHDNKKNFIFFYYESWSSAEERHFLLSLVEMLSFLLAKDEKVAYYYNENNKKTLAKNRYKKFKSQDIFLSESFNKLKKETKENILSFKENDENINLIIKKEIARIKKLWLQEKSLYSKKQKAFFQKIND